MIKLFNVVIPPNRIMRPLSTPQCGIPGTQAEITHTPKVEMAGNTTADPTSAQYPKPCIARPIPTRTLTACDTISIADKRPNAKEEICTLGTDFGEATSEGALLQILHWKLGPRLRTAPTSSVVSLG